MKKKCGKCGVEKPANTDYFGKHRNGFQSWCKECKNKRYQENKEVINRKKREERASKKEKLPEGMKRCNRCKKLKPMTEEYFQILKKAKDGFRYACKECRNAEYIENREHNNSRSRKYYNENKKEIALKNKEYKEMRKDWYKKYYQQYYDKNQDEIKENVKKNHYFRMENDLGYKLLQRCRNRVYKALKGLSKSKSTIELIGCTPDKLIKHIEKQFKEGMTWENYGAWHLDHIIPCALFDFTDESQQRECFHYTNLQPLWAEDNMKKSDKYEGKGIQ